MNQIGVIITAVIGLAGKVFSKGWRYLVKSELTAIESIIGEVLSGNRDVKVTSTAEAGINGGGGNSGGSTGEKSEADGTPDDKPFSFPRFEIVQQCPSDHHYINNMDQVRNFFFSDTVRNCGIYLPL